MREDEESVMHTNHSYLMFDNVRHKRLRMLRLWRFQRRRELKKRQRRVSRDERITNEADMKEETEVDDWRE